MTTKLYRKAFASVALAGSLLLTGAAAKVQANTASDLSGLTSQELLSGQVSTGNTDLLVTDSSQAIADIVHSSVTGPVDPVSGFMAREAVDLARSRAAQEAYEGAPFVSQSGSTPVDGTFAPLTDEEIRQLLLINPEESFLDRPRPAPGSGFLTPSAYGADWGDAFIGLSGVTAGRTDNKWDGSAALGMGFGDAVENIGVEVSVGIISLDGFAEDGTVGFKLHRVFPEADNLAVAVGWSNALKWGAANNAQDTFYGVVTHRFDLQPGEQNPLPLTASLGVGTGTFRSAGAIAAGNNDPNIFGSLGLRVIPELSLVSGWTGSGLGLGISAAPFEFPLVITAGVSDVTGNTRTGARFNASLGYSFSF